PFVLTSDEIPEYDILYAGQQQEDELHCYVFDIAPQKIEGKKRYFQGRIWVDDHDFQIVKTYGKTVPDIRKKKSNENLFPKFTTWREQIDGKYWFPTYTKADDTLHFSNQDVSHQQTHLHLSLAFAKLIVHARLLAPDFAPDLRHSGFLLSLRTWPGRGTRSISTQRHHCKRDHSALHRQRKRVEATA